MLGEAPARRLEQPGPATRRPERREGAPVDGHGEPWAKHRQRVSRSLWIEVSRAEARPPAPDGKQREIQIDTELRHASEQRGVAREIRIDLGLNHIADGTAAPDAEDPPAPVAG